jgi:DNA-binding CsgD family transcriptional regulator/PAS domain-containing protein
MLRPSRARAHPERKRGAPFVQGRRRRAATTVEVVQDLVTQIYEAVLDEQLWQSFFLGNLADAVGGSSAIFFSEDIARRHVGFMAACRSDPSGLDAYAAHFATKDVWVQSALGRPAGAVVSSAALVPTEDFVTSEFYNDFLSHHGIFHLVTAVVENQEGRCAFASVYRPRHAGDFGPNEHKLMGVLSPHLRRALQLRSRQLIVGAQADSYLDALAALAQGVVLVDRTGTIVWASPAAESLFSTQDGLLARRRQLYAGTPHESAEILMLIQSAAKTGSDPAATPGGVMAIRRPSMRRPYQIFITPLPRAAKLAKIMPDVAKVPVAAVFITDPETVPAPPEAALQSLYGLTPAEARLAAAFAKGDTLQDYAEAAELSLNYVRWLLKQVQAKTDTRRQVELVRVLVGHAPPLAPSE